MGWETLRRFGFQRGQLMATPNDAELFAKIRALPADRVAEVEDFVDFLRQKVAEQALTRAAAQLSESAFARVWDNSDDAEYDRV